MSGLTLDVSHWPLILTWIEGPVDLASWQAYAAAFERDVMARNERIVSVFDMSGLCNLPDARTRRCIADWSRENAGFGLRHHLGLAIVAPHPLARALMKVLHWTVPPAVPTSYEANREAALRYCLRRLGEVGIDAPHLDGLLRPA